MSISRVPKKVELVQDERIIELETDVANLNKHIDMQVESMRNVMVYADEMTDKYNLLLEENTRLKQAGTGIGNDKEAEYLSDLLANKDLSGDQKVVLWIIRKIILRMRYDVTQPLHIWMGEIANKTGLGDKTVRRATNELHEMRLIVKDTRGKGKEQKTYFNLVNEYTISVQIQEKQVTIPEKQHGGKRCHYCGSEKLEKMTYRCKDCGEYGAFE
jgi:hypothetical protein